MQLSETLEIISEGFKPNLKKHCYSIQLYGSASPTRQRDYIEGWSDIDILLVPNYDFICPIDYYKNLGVCYKDIRERMEEKTVDWGIEEEISLYTHDISTLTSNYLWMIEGFKEHLQKSSTVFWSDGHDMKEIITKINTPSMKHASTAFALFKTREVASMWDYLEEHNHRELKKNFKRSMKSIKNFYRNTVPLRGEKLRKDDSNNIRNQFKQVFPEIDENVVEEINSISYRWPKEHKTMDSEEMRDLFFKALRLREETIKILSNEQL